MSVRAARLISLVLLLQARGRLTAQQLADEVGVSVRTIYRDAEALHAAGIPLYTELGPGGGFRLVGGHRTQLTGLTADEARALFLAGLPGPAGRLGLDAGTTALKLRAALPAPLRERADQLSERFHLDAPGWYHDGDDAPLLGEVATALWEQRLIRVRYRSWTGEATRELEPWGIVLKGGKWYLVAGAAPARTYRVQQVRTADILDATFERPAGFSLPEWWQEHLAEFRAGLYQGEARIRLTPAGVERMREVLGSTICTAADATAALLPDGRVEAVVPIESTTHAHTEFLKLGAEVEVLAPDPLRRALAETARRLGEIYRENG
jgi:predicted DNA-binding transcriptional regulator YafY